MYIGRLQLKGFKSFGGQHDLILSPGFTAIVGPNGSGKSNLLDALRWSLGDSSAGKLRIARQSDLLFQGSGSLPSAREGEVLLQLRDESRACSIKRRVLAPEGTTLLMVDNTRKTLGELDETKRDWGLDGIKFAFIGQGEVAEVIQERPLARRMRLESLFGIDVYRKRRTEASDRLGTVKEEYEQLRNLTAEFSARREEIAPEVKRAAQLREILDTLEDERKLLYWLRRARSIEALERILLEIEEAARQRQSLTRWSRLWQHGIDIAESELAKVAQSRQNQTWELEQCKNSYDTLTRSGYASANSLMTSNGRLTQAKAERDSAKERYEKLVDEQKKSAEAEKATRANLEKSNSAYAAIEKKWQEFNELREREKEQRAEWSRGKGNLESELLQIKAKLEFLGKDLIQLRSKKHEAPAQRKGIDLRIKELEDARDVLLKGQNELVARHGELYAKCQTLAAELQRAKREAQASRSRLNEVIDAVQSELYPSPVQYLLSAAKLGRLNAAPRALIDTFTCDPSLSSALDAFLGGRQFQLLVEDMEEAIRCIDMLKVNMKGRATFLPLERCRPRFPDKGARLPKDGVTGWAMDLIKPEERWIPAIQQIMGDLLIVDNAEVGKNLVRSGFRGPITTLEGDVFQPGGTVSGGRSAKTGKAIEMKSQLAKLEADSATSAAAAERLGKEFKTSEAEELEVAEKKEAYTKQIRETDGRIAILLDERESITKEQKRVEGERGRILETLNEEGKRHYDVLKSLAELEEKWNMEASIEDDTKLIEERERLRAEVAVATEQVRSGFAIMERLSNELRVEERKVWSLDEEISELDQKCVRERANLARVGKGCLEISERRRKLVAEIEKYVGGFSKLEKRRDYMRRRLIVAETKTRSDTEKSTLLEAKKGETGREIEELIATWEEQYPYPGAQALPEDANADELRRKIRDGDRKIKAFGNVDMGVLSEDRNLKDRLAFLGDQLDDVRGSALELERLIQEADAQAHKTFTSALQEVDSRFCLLFQRLFGGGEAHLEMLEGNTIWDSGVDVVARPPGKHPQSINQLSGGEQSLSAISLLFASMEVARCPLAVLDEVDAALDEVNLRRFSELAKEYAKNRQILAMTHRRVTMERADVLYGVTLSEPGLSQVIGVKLEDWA